MFKAISSKLKSKWDGPMVVIEIFENGAMLIENPKNRTQLKVNGQRIKPFIEVEIQGSTLTLVPKIYTLHDPNQE